MDLSTVMQSPDFLGRRSDASQLVGQKLNSIQKVPPYEKKSTSQRMLEGGIGGAVAGASVASLMGAGGGGTPDTGGAGPLRSLATPSQLSGPDSAVYGGVDVTDPSNWNTSGAGPTFGSKISDFFSGWSL